MPSGGTGLSRVGVGGRGGLETRLTEVRSEPTKNPFHPGEVLFEEFLEPAELTQTEFAQRVGWTRARLNEPIRGKRGITAEAALDLAEALGTSPKFWMNLQATYDLDRAAKTRGAGARPHYRPSKLSSFSAAARRPHSRDHIPAVPSRERCPTAVCVDEQSRFYLDYHVRRIMRRGID